MKHECEKCVWAKKGDGTGLIVKGHTVYINDGELLQCTAKVIAKLDLRRDEIFCSSFKPREGTGGI